MNSFPSRVNYGGQREYRDETDQAIELSLSPELELKYKLNRSRVITFMPTNIFPLVVHPPNTAPPDRLTAITIQPGMVFEVAMKQV